MRATRHEARGQRSSACFSFHEALWSGIERRVDGVLVRRERRGSPGEQVEDRRRRRAARRRSTRTSRRRRPGRSGPAASPTRSARSPAIRVPGPPQRQAVAAQALELRRDRARAPRTPARGARGSAAPRSATRRRRRSRGRPSANTQPYPPGMSASSTPPAARSARATTTPYGTFPSYATPWTMPAPSPSARAVVPFAPSAPTITPSATARRRASIVVRPRRSSLAHLAPRSRAASSRNASRRRRCVIRITGRADAALDGVAVAEPQLDDVDLLLDDRRRIDRALPDGAHRQPAAARLVAREASPCRRAAPTRPHSASRYAVVEPAGPPPTTRTSKRFICVRLQSPRARGGVPERPKGTGCKPVGSAYGGSNPPAPINRNGTMRNPHG